MSRIKSLVAVALLAALSSCSEGSPTALSSPNLHLVSVDGVRLLTQNFIPELTMDALFQGKVVVDEAGCTRLDGPDDATVIWPVGFTIQASVEGPVVLDRSGEQVGRLGDEFSLPGGEIEELHPSMGYTDADRALAARHCPGRYWIAGSS